MAPLAARLDTLEKLVGALEGLVQRLAVSPAVRNAQRAAGLLDDGEDSSVDLLRRP